MQGNKTNTGTNSHPIDAVILWVDGNDEAHFNKILSYIKDTEKLKSKKFKTRYKQVNEIEYTVKSILKFAPYIRNIFIVTDNQTPKFLTENKSKDIYKNVSIVDHGVIFEGHEEFLPIFNCRPIETSIYKIPNLAEHFIYLNDDFFIINETKPSDFFKDGLPVLRGKWLKFDKDILYKKFKKPKTGHKSIQQNAAKLVGFNKYYNFKHTPHPLRKSTFENYFKENKDVFINNIKYRFRDTSQFTPQGLANHLEIKNNSCVLKDDLQLMYFRSYKKPLLWYKIKLNIQSKQKLFLGMQSLDLCPPKILSYLLNWLEKRVS
ncbi:Stealth CR1 domain-containing protein [Formosa maritima]|uniref:Capsular biosynthesis protein n=1 Tax=Formosa maritima TaxID=2592046 RepID=A0A5D0G6D7_9FLAO|nr:Stealth CR1 domain-containing protein [Formosa maritima]TYA53879.1 hypothetical protein FVF61_09720 [Formosa maritima]